MGANEGSEATIVSSSMNHRLHHSTPPMHSQILPRAAKLTDVGLQMLGKKIKRGKKRGGGKREIDLF